MKLGTLPMAASNIAALLLLVATTSQAQEQQAPQEAATTNNDKEFKICDVLGGLDVTRFVSTRARGFFAAAIDDVDLAREFAAEAMAHRSTVSDFATLQEMSQTLDWKARNLSQPVYNMSVFPTLEAGLGYTDDRADRRYV